MYMHFMHICTFYFRSASLYIVVVSLQFKFRSENLPMNENDDDDDDDDDDEEQFIENIVAFLPLDKKQNQHNCEKKFKKT